MLFIASWVIQNRWLLLLGGLYLIKLAVDHLGETPMEARAAAAEAAGKPVPRLERSFWSVVVAVELADLAFSLDNALRPTPPGRVAADARVPGVHRGIDRRAQPSARRAFEDKLMRTRLRLDGLVASSGRSAG